jgi:hypothetical protein
MRIKALALAAAIAGATFTGAPGAARAEDDPAFFAFTGGWFDANKRKDDAFEGRIEYRGGGAERFWLFKPMGGIMATSDGAGYLFAGVLIDLYFGNRLVLTPSFAPGAYFKGGGKDLGSVLEFRSGLELSYRFDDRSRLGIGISHMSNASLGDKNPGEETLFITYAIPAAKLFNW